MNAQPVTSEFDEELFGFDFLAELDREEITDQEEFAEEDGVWRTVRGRKVFIREGEDLDTALKRSLDVGKSAVDPSDQVKSALKRAAKGKGLTGASLSDADRKSISEFVEKLPGSKDPVYRGMWLSSKEWEKKFDAWSVGKDVSFRGLESFTSDSIRASSYGSGGDVFVKFMLPEGVAKDISKWSIYPEEQEHLLPTAQSFKIVERKLHSPGFWNITLAPIKEHADEAGVWRTVRGRRVFIKEGETPTEAIKRSIAERTQRSIHSHIPATKERQLKAAQYEETVAKLISGKNLDDHEPFDVIKGQHAVEVKVLISGKNSKVTMHPDSLARKNQFLRKEKMSGHTVVIDARGPKPVYYYREGVGSFRLDNMRTVKGGELKGLIT